MKRFLFGVLMVLFLASNVMALGDIEYNEYGGDATAIAAPVANAVAGANATALANQQQGQLQGQIQGQGQVAVGLVNTGVDTKVDTNITVEKPLMNAPSVALTENNFITGEVGRYNLLPTFANLKQLKEQKVKGILYYSYGNVFSRITPEEIPAIILEQAEINKDKVAAYDVICKKASYTFNLGTGGAGAGSNASGYSASGLGIVGGGWAVADAYCAIWVYEVE